MRMRILPTLIAPAVDPAHPPINIKVIRTALENEGHMSKSTVEKPVVLMIETT